MCVNSVRLGDSTAVEPSLFLQTCTGKRFSETTGTLEKLGFQELIYIGAGDRCEIAATP